MKKIKPVKKRIKKYMLKDGEAGYVELPNGKCIKKTSGMITTAKGRLFIGTESEIDVCIVDKKLNKEL